MMFVIHILLLICLVSASSAGAQTFSGAQVTGVIRDSNGGVTPGATITATNTETNLMRQTLSNENGVYTLPALPIGVYDITAELAGFQTEVQKGIKLQVGDNLRVNFTLEVGRVTDTVTVTGEVPSIQSESAALGTVVNNKIVTEMPLNGRVFYDLVQLVAGAVSPAPNSTLANRGGVNIAGARETSNAYTIDGIDNVSNGTNGPQVKLSIEMLQEFKVLTNSYSPEYGRGSGGNVVMTTRSGTSEYRGTVWEFLRNSALDAKNLFDPPDCTPATAGQRCGGVPPLHRSQFGYVAGGPVPKIKNLFFFQGYEGTRLNQSLTSVATVPIAAFHQGDFSSLLPKTVIKDPVTGQAFQNNVILSNRWDPVGKAFLDLYPVPTNGLATNNLVTNPIKSVPNDQLTGRLDYNRGKNNYFIRHIWNREGLREPFPGRGLTNGVPGFGWDDPLVGNNFMMGATFVFSPSSIGNLRLGINHMLEPNINRNLIPFNQQIGLAGTSPLPINYGRPAISVTGYSGVGDNQNTPGERDEWSHEANYTQTILIGNHNLSAGFNFRLTHIDHKLPNARRGNFSFDGTLSGNAVADVLLGYPRQSQITPDTANFRTHQRGSNPSAFFNDDWKVTPNLTLNAGMRWEFTTAMQDADDAISSFDFVTGKIIVPDVNRLPAGFDRSLVENSPYGRGLRHNYYRNLEPRVGLAYTFNPRTVIRSGYGIFTDILSYGNAQIGFVQNSPWFPTKTYRVDSTTGPAISLSNSPFPDKVFNAPLLTLTGWDPNYKDGYVQNWNFSIQRQLMTDLVLETAYIGSKGTRLFFADNVNQAYVIGGALGSAPAQQARKIYPAFSNITREQNSGDSHFHGFQLKVERRLTAGFSVLGTYMWSKSIDNSSVPGGGGVQDALNLAAQRGLSDFDTRHRFVTNFNYAVPLGQGHAYLSSGVASKVLGDWQMGGILTLQSGRPSTPTLSGDNSNTGGGADRPNLIGDPNSGAKTTASFWNAKAFAMPASNTFGNAARNSLIGPGMCAFDFSLMKNIPFSSERRRAQFRAEFFNIFNHPILAQPASQVNVATFGTITSTLVNTTSRQIQLALKVFF